MSTKTNKEVERVFKGMLRRDGNLSPHLDFSALDRANSSLSAFDLGLITAFRRRKPRKEIAEFYGRGLNWVQVRINDAFCHLIENYKKECAE